MEKEIMWGTLRKKSKMAKNEIFDFTLQFR